MIDPLQPPTPPRIEPALPAPPARARRDHDLPDGRRGSSQGSDEEPPDEDAPDDGLPHVDVRA